MARLSWVGVGVALGVSLATSHASAASLTDWLLTPISGNATHEIAASTAWHGRLMARPSFVRALEDAAPFGDLMPAPPAGD